MQKTSMKLGSGRTQYSDFELPFYAISQDDWAGGRAGKNLLDDPTRYADGDGVMTWIPKRLTLGPQVHTDQTWTGPPFGMVPTPTTAATVGIYDYVPLPMLAQTFTPATTQTVRGVRMYYKVTSAAPEFVWEFMQVGIFTTVDGIPDALLVVKIAQITETADGMLTVWFDSPVTLTAATVYAMRWYMMDAGDLVSTVQLYGHTESQYTGQALRYTGSGTWGAHPTIADFGVEIISEPYECRMFHYRGLLHAGITRGDAGGTLYRRGTLAIATGGTRWTLVDAGAFDSTWEGRTIVLVEGTGAGQWGIVADVPDANTLTMDREWMTIPDATTIYAAKGSWATAAAIAHRITDVAVVDTVVYLAHGAGQVMERYRWESAGGAAIADDGTNQAEFLVLFRDENNDPALWRGLGYEVSNAGLQAWGTALTFNTALRVGSSDSRITALTVYDDHLYTGKEDGLWALQEEIVRQVPVDFSALRSVENCQRMKTWNLYLIFPILYGLQRLSGTQVDDFGPNGGEGLPDGRQGPVSAIMPMPGMLVVAIDAGKDDMSSVMVYNQLGWHEFARSLTDGLRITDLAFETLPDGEQRLWWYDGGYMRYAWMSGRVFDRSQDARADYATTGTLETGYLGTDLVDVDKLWHEVNVFSDSANISLQYQIEDGTWTSATLSATDGNKRTFTLAYSTGRVMKLRLTLTGSGSSTPVVEAITVEALGRIEPTYSYTSPVILDLATVTMAGRQLGVDVGAVIEKLAEWSGSATALTMTHVLEECDGARVLLEPVPSAVAMWTGDGTQEQRRVLTLTMVDVT